MPHFSGRKYSAALAATLRHSSNGTGRDVGNIKTAPTLRRHDTQDTNAGRGVRLHAQTPKTNLLVHSEAFHALEQHVPAEVPRVHPA